ncbi:sacsin N-terminal ATP-binding-like domain-containing protein [Sciscionella marina]|uniref:sacsin N-terminal ATP-binding-like domain-containing protein n=1 Tax=Sciscionella marina TaxID=508770 RepID=UPI00037CEB2F|nr:ATP-binding protein [Sciscionella marina]
MADPFGTAELRARVLRAWTESPSRFREDANAEEDLRIGGYRDRVLVELAQNAADAADEDGGELSIALVDGELRAANTGSPLDAEGVRALASLRASAKREGTTTGHFGVGFAAVLAISAEPRVCSATGGVRFSREDTRAELAAIPELAGELAAREGAVPVLRLVWPCSDPVPEGFTTEVRLPLSSGIDAGELLEQAHRLAPDLLLALPALCAITVDGQRVAAERQENGRLVIGGTRWAVSRTGGQVRERGGLGVEEARGYAVTWAVEVDAAGAPLAHGPDVLHTPTPTDERLALPARLLATVPMEPSRRRVRAGSAGDEVFDAAVAAYPDLVRAFAPEHRLRLVPLPGFPVSEVDGRLREALLDRFRTEPLLPGADGEELSANSALVLEHRSRALISLVNSVLPGLLDLGEAPGDREALRALGVRTVGLAELVERCLGIDREPHWWHELYAALAAVVDAGADRDELGALPIPLLDGRTTNGPRGVLLPTGELAGLDGLEDLELPIVHPAAAHPLLARLGAVRAGPAELLDSAELRAAVERSAEDAAAGLDTTGLAEVVLRLVGELGADRDWLGALALTDTEGGPRRADELLFADARVRPVLDPEAIGQDRALGILAEGIAQRHPREALRAIGVLDGFAVVADEQPDGPDHGLADEDQWWETEPRLVHGIRDLDLVAEDSWAAALTIIAGDPETWRALAEPGGYTGWWIARYARLAGRAPRRWRLAAAGELAGLYDPLPPGELPDTVLRAAGVRASLHVEDAEDARDLLEALAEEGNEPSQGAVLRAHEELGSAVLEGRFELSTVDAPDRVRTVGGLADAEEALVADVPWWYGTGLGELVPVRFGLAEPLARLLDLPLASEELEAGVRGGGEAVPWRGLHAVTLAAELLGIPAGDGEVLLHDPLTVAVDSEEIAVPWWFDGTNGHAEDSERGLARAFAWCSGHWEDRHRIEALLADPELSALLG